MSAKVPEKPARSADYEHLLEVYRAEFSPRDVHERFLVETMAHAQWKLLRIQQMRAGANETESGPTNTAAKFLDRYAAAAQKSYDRAYRELMKSQKQRTSPKRSKTAKLKPPDPPFDTAFRA